MKLKINWSKVFLDFYPADMVKQFKKVSLPFYLSFSLLFFYLIQNIQPILLSKAISGETVFVFYFLFPVVFPLSLLGLFLSSIHILRHNNPLFLYHLNFKHLILYGINFGMIVFSALFLGIYGFLMNQVFGWL